MLARKQQDVTREAASASHDAIGPDADPDLRFLLPDIHHETIASRDVVRGSPWREAPRIGRSSIPIDRGRSPRQPKARQLAGSDRSIQRAREQVMSRKTRPRLCALSSPRFVRGKSVRPVCSRLHAVSPCLARRTIGRTALIVWSWSLQSRPLDLERT